MLRHNYSSRNQGFVFMVSVSICGLQMLFVIVVEVCGCTDGFPIHTGSIFVTVQLCRDPGWGRQEVLLTVTSASYAECYLKPAHGSIMKNSKHKSTCTIKWEDFLDEHEHLNYILHKYNKAYFKEQKVVRFTLGFQTLMQSLQMHCYRKHPLNKQSQIRLYQAYTGSKTLVLKTLRINDLFITWC